MAFGQILLAGYSGSPERARWLHLARSGSQSQRAIWFILPAHRAGRIIVQYINFKKKINEGFLWGIFCYL